MYRLITRSGLLTVFVVGERGSPSFRLGRHGFKAGQRRQGRFAWAVTVQVVLAILIPTVLVREIGGDLGKLTA